MQSRDSVAHDRMAQRDPQPRGDDIERLEQQLESLRRRERELEARLSSVLASTSWRITAPLRAIVDLLRSIGSGRWRDRVRALRAAVARERRRRGWLGLLARLAFHLARRGDLRRLLDRAATARVPPDADERPRRPPRRHPDLEQDVPPTLDASVSVVIPTLNAGPEFDFLLRKLRSQQAVRALEIIVIDSGSDDGTVEAAEAAGARVVRIERSAFSHSATRNRGAELAGGDYVLFMVQDAYPIGDRWVHGMLSYLIEHRAERVVAASCVEYCRSDSDLWAECSIATHSRFLGCKDDDRIGFLRGVDHESLRAMGQLSDVACLVQRELFLRYRYRGSYAEDLDLGVRLIRDGYRTAMLASVRVVHSHRRTSIYALKRSFVDIDFLRDVFADFPLPSCHSARGIIVAARHVAREVDAWSQEIVGRPEARQTLRDCTDRWLRSLQRLPLRGELPDRPMPFDDSRLDGFVRSLNRGVRSEELESSDAAANSTARLFVDDFVARFDYFSSYAAELDLAEGERLRREWADAAAKAFATTLGSMLAALHVNSRSRPASDPDREWIDALAAELTAGV